MAITQLPGPLDTLNESILSGLVAGNKFRALDSEIATQKLQNDILSKRLSFMDEEQSLANDFQLAQTEFQRSQDAKVDYDLQFAKLLEPMKRRQAEAQAALAEDDVPRAKAESGSRIKRDDAAARASNVQADTDEIQQIGLLASVGAQLVDENVNPWDASVLATSLAEQRGVDVKEQSKVAAMIMPEILRVGEEKRRTREGLKQEREALLMQEQSKALEAALKGGLTIPEVQEALKTGGLGAALSELSKLYPDMQTSSDDFGDQQTAMVRGLEREGSRLDSQIFDLEKTISSYEAKLKGEEDAEYTEEANKRLQDIIDHLEATLESKKLQKTDADEQLGEVISGGKKGKKSRFKEGDIIDGPNGEVKVRRGGKWVTIK